VCSGWLVLGTHQHLSMRTPEFRLSAPQCIPAAEWRQTRPDGQRGLENYLLAQATNIQQEEAREGVKRPGTALPCQEERDWRSLDRQFLYA